MFWHAHLAFGLAIVSTVTVDPMLLLLGALLALVSDLDKPFGHRHWFSHSIYAALMFAAVALIASGFQPIYAIVVFIAVASHVALDFLTKSGVPILYPWKKKHYGLRLFSANNKKANGAIVIMSLLVLLSNLWRAYPL